MKNKLEQEIKAKQRTSNRKLEMCMKELMSQSNEEKKHSRLIQRMFNKNKQLFQRTRKADIIAYLEHKLYEMENKLEKKIKGKKRNLTENLIRPWKNWCPN